jgi:2-polyprenyl-6-methoxyphenol hydroxylase-like FAD-dependent oxidoreductase
MDADFIIVGGGIGGTVLAELLGRGGKRVVVLEKSTAPPPWLRPEVLWPATMKVLFSLAPQQVWEAEDVLAVRGMELHDERGTLPFITPQLLEEAGVQPWFTNPNQTRERLLRLGAFELRRGVEVVAVLKEKERVVGVRTRELATSAEREVLAACTIGDDGGHSLVRQACNIPLEARMFPIDFLCFAFEWPATLPAATACVWLNPRRIQSGIFALLAMPFPQGKSAGLVTARSAIFDNLERAQEEWQRFVSADPAMRPVTGSRKLPADFVRVRRAWGHAPRYGCTGALLLGDAAHPVSPAGGQGANMSVADACALAEIVLSNHPQPLAEYERRRRPANQRSLLFTRVAARVIGLPNWCLRLLPFGPRQVMGRPWIARRFVQTAATAFQE